MRLCKLKSGNKAYSCRLHFYITANLIEAALAYEIYYGSPIRRSRTWIIKLSREYLALWGHNGDEGSGILEDIDEQSWAQAKEIVKELFPELIDKV